MKTTTASHYYNSNNIIEAIAEVTMDSIRPSGYGHWMAKGKVEIRYKGVTNERTITVTTTNASYFEDIKSAESKDDYNMACEAIEQLLIDHNEVEIDTLLYELAESVDEE